MLDFLTDVKQYIEKSFEEDKDIKSKVPVVFQYMQAHKPTNEIQIMTLNNRNEPAYDSYDSENVYYVPLQIVPVTSKQDIAGKTVSAQRAAMYYAEKLNKLFNKFTAQEWNHNIMRMNAVGSDFSMPYEEGSVLYVAPVRFDVYVKVPYEPIYQ